MRRFGCDHELIKVRAGAHGAEVTTLAQQGDGMPPWYVIHMIILQY